MNPSVNLEGWKDFLALGYSGCFCTSAWARTLNLVTFTLCRQNSESTTLSVLPRFMRTVNNATRKCFAHFARQLTQLITSFWIFYVQTPSVRDPDSEIPAKDRRSDLAQGTLEQTQPERQKNLAICMIWSYVDATCSTSTFGNGALVDPRSVARALGFCVSICQ